MPNFNAFWLHFFHNVAFADQAQATEVVKMSTELILRSGLPWLEHQRQDNSGPPLQPLLLLPGDGGEGVQLEAALLLACSPLLRRTLSSTSCCSCSCATTAVMLPFTNSAALAHLGQMLSQGRVTIASEALTNLGTLLALLEVDISWTTGVKRKAAHENESRQEKHPKIASDLSETSPKVLLPSPPEFLRVRRGAS